MAEQDARPKSGHVKIEHHPDIDPNASIAMREIQELSYKLPELRKKGKHTLYCPKMSNCSKKRTRTYLRARRTDTPENKRRQYVETQRRWLNSWHPSFFLCKDSFRDQ